MLGSGRSGWEGEIKDKETSLKEEKLAKQVERKKNISLKRDPSEIQANFSHRDFEICLVRLTIAGSGSFG